MSLAQLLAADAGLGGIWVRGDADAIVKQLRALMPVHRCPVHIDRERLLGGLDLSATLATGHPVTAPGLLETSAGGAVVVNGAERLEPDIAGALAAALDAGSIRLVLIDNGVDGETVPDVLAERVAFWADADDPVAAGLSGDAGDDPVISDEALHSIAATAGALGISSMRAPLFAIRAARALARGDNARVVSDAHLVEAVRLVLVPRATQWPQESPDAAESPPETDAKGEGAGDAGGPLADAVLDAVKATLPPGLLDAIRARAVGGKAKGRGRGARRRAPTRGRPVGTRPGLPRGGARLALLDTLRAAAPWQKLRGAQARIAVRKADLRVRRFRDRAAMTTIFAVDASGSAAAARMAEAKGAVELLLTQAYVKRAQVALIAFRGEGAATIVPPTRSLTRARKLLAELPGGGGTPIAAGLDAARLLALSERAKDRTPHIVLLTDGRANMPADGNAQVLAEQAAQAVARDGLDATLIDISARPRAEGQRLADALGGRYIALPRGGAADVSRAIS
jgi:magnesium chelatase subunit D